MKQVKRVSKKEFEEFVENRIAEGFKVDSKTDRQAILIKRKYGGVLGHAVVFVIFGWWTMLLANLGYALYCYATKSDELVVKITKK